MSKINEGFKVDKSEYTKLFNDKDYLLVVPHTHTASCKYGANTKWCTTKRDDDTDFEEHITMGVLVYLIIKNPEISKYMGSEKFGLYRGNGYSMTDLIVYDELNNEHLKGINYLSNEFEKADKDSDFWKILSVYNDYYKTMDISSLGGKPDKLNENINVDMIKDLCNRMVIKTKGSFGNLPKLNIVYYTKGGRIVDIEKTKGDLKAPFKLGDSINDLVKWARENNIEQDIYPRRNRRLKEQEEGEEDSTIFIESFEPTLYNICYSLLTGKLHNECSEEDLNDIVEKHGDEHLKDIVLTGNRQGFLVYEFTDSDDFSEYFSENAESYWTYDINNTDYDYYTDSAYQDAESENYHWIQLKLDRQILLTEKLMESGFKFKHYEEAKKKNQEWSHDELAWELRHIFEFHFSSYDEKLSEEYQDTLVKSYAEGFHREMRNVWEQWVDNAESAGIEEVSELEEYHVDPAKLFRFMIKQSSRGDGTLNGLIEGNSKLRNAIGSGSDVFAMSEGKYNYEVPEYWDEFKEYVDSFIKNFIDEELTDNEYLKEMSRENTIATKLGFEPLSYYDKQFKEVLESSWGNRNETAEQMGRNAINRGLPKENVRKLPDGRTLIYLGYSMSDDGHVVFIEPTKEDLEKISSWRHKKLYKKILTIEELATLLKQTRIDFDKPQLSEQEEGEDDNIMVYYALTGDLQNYYGEDNVTLTGKPPKITVNKIHTITLLGNDLYLNGKKIVVKDTVTHNINGGTVYSPSIEYITNRVQKQTELPSNYTDGTKLRASQNFWNDIKTDEGLAGTNGKPSLEAYRLGDGRITIGWGHTGALSNPKPKMGDKITADMAQKYLQNDATEAADCVRRMLKEWKVKGLSTYKVTQNMFDVLVSLAFNAGCQGLRTSNFIQLVKKGEYKEAAKLLPTDTTMIHGKFTKGLTARREREAKRFLE